MRAKKLWFSLLGVACALISPVFAQDPKPADNMSASSQMRVTWRLAAWLISAAAFAAHICWEHFRPGNSSRATAFHAAMAAAVRCARSRSSSNLQPSAANAGFGTG
jgi:hypothetical protein